MKANSMSNTTRSLRALLPHYTGPDYQLSNLVEHSGAVISGSCFIARVRETSDGHPYIGTAIAAGAHVIIGQRPRDELDVEIPSNVAYIHVSDSAETMAQMAAAWEGHPSRSLTIIGITGTNGKTSTSDLLYSILQAAGIHSGLISTIRAVLGEKEEPTGLHITTPGAPAVQRYLRRMVDAGLTHCVLETTSHGLAQHRVTAVDFDIAAITNLTHEHLDYHGSFEAYTAAKARLFEMVGKQPDGTAVLNYDDPSYEKLRRIPTKRILSFGNSDMADIYASDIQFGANETRFVLHISDTERIPVRSPLVGAFNVSNMLTAAAIAVALGIDSQIISRGLGAVSQISGRMERITGGQPFLTLVDFAHTPDALEKAIAATRTMLTGTGRIITVFGSAGKRDISKRRLMAEISGRDAELTILTAEDPRTESLDDILEMMAAACCSVGGRERESFWRIRDRGRAIYFALTLAQPDDIVLICGKGHEQSMCFGTTEYPWDDRDATRAALNAFLAQEPMPDLGLPTF